MPSILLSAGETVDTAANVVSMLQPFFETVAKTVLALIGAAVTGGSVVIASKWGINWAINFFGGLVKKK